MLGIFLLRLLAAELLLQLRRLLTRERRAQNWS
jgi:hypothetical protein